MPSSIWHGVKWDVLSIVWGELIYIINQKCQVVMASFRQVLVYKSQAIILFEYQPAIGKSKAFFP